MPIKAVREKDFITKNRTISLKKASTVFVQNNGNVPAYFDDILISTNGGFISLDERLLADVVYNFDVNIEFDPSGITNPKPLLLIYRMYYKKC